MFYGFIYAVYAALKVTHTHTHTCKRAKALRQGKYESKHILMAFQVYIYIAHGGRDRRGCGEEVNLRKQKRSPKLNAKPHKQIEMRRKGERESCKKAF